MDHNRTSGEGDQPQEYILIKLRLVDLQKRMLASEILSFSSTLRPRLGRSSPVSSAKFLTKRTGKDVHVRLTCALAVKKMSTHSCTLVAPFKCKYSSNL